MDKERVRAGAAVDVVEQLSLFDMPQRSRWRPEVDNGCRMWACPDCGGRMIGDFWDEGFCPYEYCPYCGARNGKRDYSHRRLQDDDDK